MGVLETIIGKMDSPNDIRMGAYQIQRDTQERKERARNRLQDNLWALGNAFQEGAEKRKSREHDLSLLSEGENIDIRAEEREEALYTPPEGQDWNTYTVNGRTYRWNDKRTYDLIPEAIRADIEASRAAALYDRDRDRSDPFREAFDSLQGDLFSQFPGMFRYDDMMNVVLNEGPFTADELDEARTWLFRQADIIAGSDAALKARLRQAAENLISRWDTAAADQPGADAIPRQPLAGSGFPPPLEDPSDQALYGFMHPGNEFLPGDGQGPEGPPELLRTRIEALLDVVGERDLQGADRRKYNRALREYEGVDEGERREDIQLQMILDALRDVAL